MAEHLYLRAEGEHFEWLLLDDASGVVRIRGEGDIGRFADMIREMSWNGTTRLMIAGEDVLLTRANVPSKQQRQILQALPYMVEEHLATDVEQCHFAAGRRGEHGAVSVAVIARDRLASLLESLAAIGIHPGSVTPDMLHIPGTAVLRVLVDGDRASLRRGRSGGFSMEQGLLPAAISLIPDEDAEALEIYVHPSQRQAFQLYLSQIEAQFTGEIDVKEIDYSPFEFLCRSFDTNAIDLLQGEFRVEEDRSDVVTVWRSVAILAGCAFALQVVLLLGRGIYLDVKANQYAREARALYAEIFPNEHSVPDIRRQWQAHVASVSGQPTGVFFDLFSKSASVLTGSPLELENVNFNESRGDLVLQLSAPRYDAFDQFAQSLRKTGLDVQIGTISQGAKGVKGSVRVKPMAGS